MSDTGLANPLPDFFHRPTVNGQPGINDTLAVSAVEVPLERRPLGTSRAFLRSHAHAVQDANTLEMREMGFRSEAREERPHRSALHVRRAKACGWRWKFTTLGDVFEQIALRPANRVESQAVVLRLLFSEFASAGPFHAPEVGMSNDDPRTRNVLLVAQLNDDVDHALAVLAGRRICNNPMVAGQVRVHGIDSEMGQQSH